VSGRCAVYTALQKRPAKDCEYKQPLDQMQSLRIHVRGTQTRIAVVGGRIIRVSPMISITPSLFLMTFVL
jgi:hypothetical protein